MTWLFVALGSTGDALPLVEIAADAVRAPSNFQLAGHTENKALRIFSHDEVFKEKIESPSQSVVLVSKGIKSVLEELLRPAWGQDWSIALVEDMYTPVIETGGDARPRTQRAQALDFIVNLIDEWDIDIVLANFYSAFAIHAAEFKNLRFVILSPSVPPQGAVQSSRKRMERLLDKFPQWKRCIENTGCLVSQVSYWMGNLISQDYLEYRKSKAMSSLPLAEYSYKIPIFVGVSHQFSLVDAGFPKNVHFCGPWKPVIKRWRTESMRMIEQELFKRLRTNHSTIFVTFGSMGTLKFAPTIEPDIMIPAGRNLAQTLLDALKSSGSETTIIIHQPQGEHALYECMDVGDGIKFYKALPHDSTVAAGHDTESKLWLLTGLVLHSTILPFCSVIVHHGGAGTVMTSLYFCKPQIVLPFAYDQEQWGLAVQEAGIGMIASVSDPTSVVSALVHVLKNYDAYRIKCAKLRSQLDWV